MVDYREDAIVVSADEPDDAGRGSYEDLTGKKLDPVIYYVTFGNEVDDEVTDSKAP